MRPSLPSVAPVTTSKNQKPALTTAYDYAFTVFGILLASLGASLPYLDEMIYANQGRDQLPERRSLTGLT